MEKKANPWKLHFENDDVMIVAGNETGNSVAVVIKDEAKKLEYLKSKPQQFLVQALSQVTALAANGDLEQKGIIIEPGNIAQTKRVAHIHVCTIANYMRPESENEKGGPAISPNAFNGDNSAN